MAHPVLIAGQWRDADSTGTFTAENPRTQTAIPDEYPTSSWADCDAALDAAVAAFQQMRKLPRETIASFLEVYADRIDEHSPAICQIATQETALPVEPRLASGELPRTSNQLRQAAAACRNETWCLPTIDTKANIRSYHAAIGPVAVFGPNNFPLAYNGISGGDFASAIAAGNPVIAKAHPLHPGTTRLLAELAQAAADETGMPAGTVQLIYNLDYEDGKKLVADPRLAAVGFTGSRHGGLALKAVADAVGTPIYLEMSSINPVVILPGAIDERSDDLLAELKTSCLMGTGQFCTSPGLVILQKSDAADAFIAQFAASAASAPVGTLLSKNGQTGLAAAVEKLQSVGAELLVGGVAGNTASATGYCFPNTVLKTSGQQFLANPEGFQTEAFGNSTMFVVVDSLEQAIEVVNVLEGNLTGCIYSAADGSNDAAYDEIASHLRQRVGRLLNDKMPTGVAVSSAMNHGGPYPATGHAGFTAVGFPASVIRFSMLQCFDNVRPQRLPTVLQDKNPGNVWRLIDGEWVK